jgi:spermidine/putrescine-binding protein
VLNRIKKNTIWWQFGAQSAQFLKDNEAQYAIVGNGRVTDQPGIDYSFKDGMLDNSWWRWLRA